MFRLRQVPPQRARRGGGKHDLVAFTPDQVPFFFFFSFSSSKDVFFQAGLICLAHSIVAYLLVQTNEANPKPVTTSSPFVGTVGP